MIVNSPFRFERAVVFPVLRSKILSVYLSLTLNKSDNRLLNFQSNSGFFVHILLQVKANLSFIRIHFAVIRNGLFVCWRYLQCSIAFLRYIQIHLLNRRSVFYLNGNYISTMF